MSARPIDARRSSLSDPESERVSCERYLAAHYPRQLAALATEAEIRAAYAVAREAERVRALRLSVAAGGYDD